RGMARRGNTVTLGDYGLQALGPAWITNTQGGAARVAMAAQGRGGGKLWLQTVPDKPMRKKPAEVRMGSGKGNPEYWVAVVRPGRVLFEVAGVSEDVAREALRLAAHKLPIKTQVVARPGLGGEAR